MPHYRFTLESKDNIQYVNINSVEGVAHAVTLVRKHFPFEEWRIINIAEQTRQPT